MKRARVIRNAAAAAGRVAKAAVTGRAVSVSDKMRAARVYVCERCPFFIATQRRCSECGCFVDLKARLATEKCPKHKWPMSNQS